MRIRVVDAFTDQPFRGNPAAVCLLDGDAWPDETWMRRVAAEMNHSETAFAHPLTRGSANDTADWALRWFTPAVEVDLCGHATLATAHALREDTGPATLRFATRSGVLVTTSHPDGTVTLDFPTAPTTEIAAPDGLADALGAKPESVHGTGTLGDLLVVLPDEAAVRELEPDLAAVAELSHRDGLRALIFTAAADRTEQGDLGQTRRDFVSRVFGPAVGIPEDPVTGSAHTALAPYWSGRLDSGELTGVQVSARGGTVHTALRGERVLLTGSAVTVLDAELLAGP